MKKALTSYDILNVSANASQADIHSAYRRLAMAWHPDRQIPSNRDRADKNFKLLQDAYNKIKSPQDRDAYNQWLRSRTNRVIMDQNQIVNDNAPLKSLLDTLETMFWPIARKNTTPDRKETK